MQRRNAVNTVTRCQTKVCHADLPVGNHRHILNLILITGKTLPQSGALSAVDLADNHSDSRQQMLHHFKRPFFQRLAQNGMVRIGEGSADNAPRIVPSHAFLVHQNPHQLRNGNGRMGIVDMNLDIFRNRRKRKSLLLMLAENPLYGRRNKEILLL